MLPHWDFLTKAVELGKIPHGIMFCGSDEIGSKALAIEFAKFINCSSKINSKTACYHCENCQKIEQGTYPDFLLVEPEDSGEIEISQIRNLIWRLSLKPIFSPFKIAVINKAHLMNQESQNCLLKILEEPKGKAILILITSYPNTLLPTIISRVQKLRFFPEKESASKRAFTDNAEIISNFLKILKSDLSFRFKYVKNLLPEDIGKLENTLNIWTLYLRTVLIKKLKEQEFEERNNFKDYSLKRMAEIISQLQYTGHLLSTTNINPKLALEALLLKL